MVGYAFFGLYGRGVSSDINYRESENSRSLSSGSWNSGCSEPYLFGGVPYSFLTYRGAFFNRTLGMVASESCPEARDGGRDSKKEGTSK